MYIILQVFLLPYICCYADLCTSPLLWFQSVLVLYFLHFVYIYNIISSWQLIFLRRYMWKVNRNFDPRTYDQFPEILTSRAMRSFIYDNNNISGRNIPKRIRVYQLIDLTTFKSERWKYCFKNAHFIFINLQNKNFGGRLEYIRSTCSCYDFWHFSIFPTTSISSIRLVWYSSNDIFGRLGSISSYTDLSITIIRIRFLINAHEKNIIIIYAHNILYLSFQ